jgi:hypothetical protein
VNNILADNGIDKMVAWEDGLRGTGKSQCATESVAIDFWETQYWGVIGGLALVSPSLFLLLFFVLHLLLTIPVLLILKTFRTRSTRKKQGASPCDDLICVLALLFLNTD